MRLTIAITILASALTATAQKTVCVTAEYIYYAPENVTIEEAKQTALERAQIQAIADEFGSVVSQTNATHIENVNGAVESEFLSIGGSELKGEWVETEGEPKFDILYDQGMLAVRVLVKGKIRKITSTRAEFDAKILRNGTTAADESSEFRDGDQMYLSFTSPVAGYLSVYLQGTGDEVYCLLPYGGQSEGIYQVKANRQYVFFSSDCAPEKDRDLVDELVLTADSDIEKNRIYVIFSPDKFYKAADTGKDETIPRCLSRRDFLKWLQKIKKRDTNLSISQDLITIRK